MQEKLYLVASQLFLTLKDRKVRIVTAESCTGGLIAATITDIPGASEVFERGFVTYSNISKIELLTVPTFYIEKFGAVSMEVATAMAEGALLISKAEISISVTGCAGPGGGTEEKPVGTVFIGLAGHGRQTIYEKFLFEGNRQEIRLQSAIAVIEMALNSISLTN